MDKKKEIKKSRLLIGFSYPSERRYPIALKNLTYFFMAVKFSFKLFLSVIK